MLIIVYRQGAVKLNNFLSIFFPEKCLICGKNISFAVYRYPHFCDECLARLEEIWRKEKRCRKCGMPFEGDEYLNKSKQMCDRCDKERYSFECNTSLYRYGGKSYGGQLLKKIFSLYKFSDRKRICVIHRM